MYVAPRLSTFAASSPLISCCFCWIAKLTFTSWFAHQFCRRTCPISSKIQFNLKAIYLVSASQYKSNCCKKSCRSYCSFVHFPQLFRWHLGFHAQVQPSNRWNRLPHKTPQSSNKLHSSLNSHWNAATKHRKVHHFLLKPKANSHQSPASVPTNSK